MRTGPTNQILKKLIEELKRMSYKEKANIWHRVAEDLESSSRKRRIVNLSKIDLHSNDNETVIVPGKVLGSGDLMHKVNIAAWQFSQSAIEKIRASKNKFFTINEIMEKNPKGKDLRIIG